MNPVESPPPHAKFAFQPAWAHSLSAGPRGVALVRERDWVLAWDHSHWLYLLNHAGQRQGQIRFPGALVCVAAADDGSAYAAAGSKGELCWLAPDLMSRWQKNL